ncbi:unnamed protein product [Timema podura]|uniref:Uncharacterized protein n=1 Tax=Timema podura TaxID=61482 RepID=A0ABN7NIX5_TIMPD|nr:unnamed protein product [Timema podura]
MVLKYVGKRWEEQLTESLQVRGEEWNNSNTGKSLHRRKKHTLVATVSRGLKKPKQLGRAPSEGSLSLDTSRAQRELISQLEAKNREIMREIARLRRQQELEAAGLSNATGATEENPALMAELRALRQRKDELESHLGALQDSRRQLMVQLEGLMKLLKMIKWNFNYQIFCLVAGHHVMPPTLILSINWYRLGALVLITQHSFHSIHRMDSVSKGVVKSSDAAVIESISKNYDYVLDGGSLLYQLKWMEVPTVQLLMTTHFSHHIAMARLMYMMDDQMTRAVWDPKCLGKVFFIHARLGWETICASDSSRYYKLNAVNLFCTQPSLFYSKLLKGVRGGAIVEPLWRNKQVGRHTAHALSINHQASPRSTPNSSPRSTKSPPLPPSSRSAPPTPGGQLQPSNMMSSLGTGADSLAGVGGDVRSAFGSSTGLIGSSSTSLTGSTSNSAVTNSSGRSLRNDLLVAADSVTNAMSTLVRELNSDIKNISAVELYCLLMERYEHDAIIGRIGAVVHPGGKEREGGRERDQIRRKEKKTSENL